MVDINNLRSSQTSQAFSVGDTQKVGIQSRASFQKKVSDSVCTTARSVKNEIVTASHESKRRVSETLSRPSSSSVEKSRNLSTASPIQTKTNMAAPTNVAPQKASFNLTEAKSKIGQYELKNKDGSNKEMPAISNKSKEKLFAGCSAKETTAKREAFLEQLHSHLENIKPGTNREITTLKELFGGNKELLKSYKEAVKEEAASKSFREAVFVDCSKALEVNPCPGQKMVMYVGGPSASGKSFTQDNLVNQVGKIKNPNQDKSPCHTVSIDGGKERELCQVRQMALQAATNNGYGGISDLHKNTKTGVKGKVMDAAMNEGENFHVVIPATFISGLPKFANLMRKLSNDPKIFQAFAEVRADKKGPLSQEKAMESFQQTIVYNGESRAYLQPGNTKQQATTMRMNNTEIGCESKIYERKYFELGVKFSEMAKSVFKTVKNDSNSMILSNESDNMHVKKEGGKWVQTTESPTVMHVSLREVSLWNELVSSKPNDDKIKNAFEALNPEKKDQFEDFKGKLEEARKQNKDFDLPNFVAFLKENGLRSNMKVTVS